MNREHPDCREMTDGQMVGRILDAKGDAAGHPYCQGLFWRYYDRFDQWVREVLAAYGKTYSDQERYYEEVFVRIYGQVFAPAALTRLLQTFDTERRFFPWLRQVVRNRAIDWVRTQGVRPLEMAAADLAERGAPAERISTEPEAFVARLNRLPESERITVRLVLAAYVDLPTADLELLSRRRGEPVESLEREAAALRDGLRETPKYSASLEAEEALGLLAYQVTALERRCREIRERLAADGVSAGVLATLEEEAQQLSLSDLPAVPSVRVRQGPEAASLASLAVELQEAVIRVSRLRQRLQERRAAVRRGQHLARASYRDVARIMGVKETDVTNFLHRARNRLTGETANW